MRTGTQLAVILDNSTDKERRKEEKRRLKEEKQNQKRADKERKAAEKQQKKMEKEADKRRKNEEKAVAKARDDDAKEENRRFQEEEKERKRRAKAAEKERKKEAKKEAKALQQQQKEEKKEMERLAKEQHQAEKERTHEAKKQLRKERKVRNQRARRRRRLRRRLARQNRSTDEPIVETSDNPLVLPPEFQKRPHCSSCLMRFRHLPKRGRSHCRSCGDSFCQQCLSKNQHPMPWYGLPKPQKVCTACDAASFGNADGAEQVAESSNPVSSTTESAASSSRSSRPGSWKKARSLKRALSLPIRPLLRRKESKQMRNRALDADLRTLKNLLNPKSSEAIDLSTQAA